MASDEEERQEDDPEEGSLMEPLTWSMQEAKVVHRRESELNGDILVEELVRGGGEDRMGMIIRRMRFLSNLELEQTEVRLLHVQKGSAPRKTQTSGSKALGKAAGSRNSRPAVKHMLQADSTYLPYECMQGMLLSIPLLPDWERKEVHENTVNLCHREKLEVLIIGLAGGMLPRFLRFNFPSTAVDTVEIDPVVVDVAREYFGLEPDDRLRVHVADGIDFVQKAPDGSYDIVIIDANAVEEDKTLEAPPPGFITEEFIAKLTKVVRPGGICTFNVLCSSPPYFRAILDRLRGAFFGRLCYLRDLAEDADENYVVFVLNEDQSSWPPSREELSRRVGELERTVPALRPLNLQDRVARHFWDAGVVYGEAC